VGRSFLFVLMRFVIINARIWLSPVSPFQPCHHNRGLPFQRENVVVDGGITKLIYEYAITAQIDDLDEMNHVNNLVYLKWCLKAAGAHSKHVGWPSKRYQASGFGFIVREHKIKYKIPALLGDQVVVKTWVETMERVSSVRRYQILRVADGKRMVEAETNWVFVNMKTLALARIPIEVRSAFELET
jgi:acyl-CoA thioester hydrolase